MGFVNDIIIIFLSIATNHTMFTNLNEFFHPFVGTTQQQQQPSQTSQTAPPQNPSATGSTLVATQFISAWDDLARYFDLYHVFKSI